MKTLKMFIFRVHDYGSRTWDSLTVEATSKTAALAIARTMEFHPTYQVNAMYKKSIKEVTA